MIGNREETLLLFGKNRIATIDKNLVELCDSQPIVDEEELNQSA
jgi:hypothetical protein